jgi:hypothetical protein
LRRKALLIVIVAMLSFAVLAMTGCGSQAPTVQKPVSEPVKQSSAPAATPGQTITMNGRSVMQGWMKHWGYEGEKPASKNGYLLDYKELNGDSIPSSFADNVGGLAPGSVVFFKFCFVDFNGSNLSQRKSELEQVIDTAHQKGLKLVVGNALPVRKQDGSPEIVAEERQFNDFLASKAAGDPTVWVYDFNGVLAGADGYLKPGYQTEDSHPNDAAYTALDQSFFPMLSKVFAGAH